MARGMSGFRRWWPSMALPVVLFALLCTFKFAQGQMQQNARLDSAIQQIAMNMQKFEELSPRLPQDLPENFRVAATNLHERFLALQERGMQIGTGNAGQAETDAYVRDLETYLVDQNQFMDEADRLAKGGGMGMGMPQGGIPTSQLLQQGQQQQNIPVQGPASMGGTRPNIPGQITFETDRRLTATINEITEGLTSFQQLGPALGQLPPGQVVLLQQRGDGLTAKFQILQQKGERLAGDGTQPLSEADGAPYCSELEQFRDELKSFMSEAQRALGGNTGPSSPSFGSASTPPSSPGLGVGTLGGQPAAMANNPLGSPLNPPLTTPKTINTNPTPPPAATPMPGVLQNINTGQPRRGLGRAPSGAAGQANVNMAQQQQQQPQMGGGFGLGGGVGTTTGMGMGQSQNNMGMGQPAMGQPQMPSGPIGGIGGGLGRGPPASGVSGSFSTGITAQFPLVSREIAIRFGQAMDNIVQGMQTFEMLAPQLARLPQSVIMANQATAESLHNRFLDSQNDVKTIMGPEGSTTNHIQDHQMQPVVEKMESFVVDQREFIANTEKLLQAQANGGGGQMNALPVGSGLGGGLPAGGLGQAPPGGGGGLGNPALGGMGQQPQMGAPGQMGVQGQIGSAGPQGPIGGLGGGLGGGPPGMGGPQGGIGGAPAGGMQMGVGMPGAMGPGAPTRPGGSAGPGQQTMAAIYQSMEKIAFNFQRFDALKKNLQRAPQNHLTSLVESADEVGRRWKPIENEAPRYEGQGPTPTEAEATEFLKELVSFAEFQTEFVNRVDKVLTETGSGAIGLSSGPGPAASRGLPPGVAMPTGPPSFVNKGPSVNVRPSPSGGLGMPPPQPNAPMGAPAMGMGSPMGGSPMGTPPMQASPGAPSVPVPPGGFGLGGSRTEL